MLEYLRVSIGGPSAGLMEIDIVVKNGIVGVLMDNHTEGYTEETVLDIERSAEWLEKLEDIGMHNWKREYFDDSAEENLEYIDWELKYKYQDSIERTVEGSDLFPYNWSEFIVLTEELFKLSDEELITKINFKYINHNNQNGIVTKYREEMTLDKAAETFSYMREFPNGIRTKQEYYMKGELISFLEEYSEWFFDEKSFEGKRVLGKPYFELTIKFGTGEEIYQTGVYRKELLPKAWEAFAESLIGMMLHFGVMAEALNPDVFTNLDEGGIVKESKEYKDRSIGMDTGIDIHRVYEEESETGNSHSGEIPSNIIEVDFSQLSK